MKTGRGVEGEVQNGDADDNQRPTILEERKTELTHEMEVLVTRAIELQEDPEHEANMVALKARRIEMVMKFEANSAAREAAVEKIEQEYLLKRQKREEEAVRMAKLKADAEAEQEVYRAAEVARLRALGRDASEVRGMCTSMLELEELRRKREREDAKEKHEAMKAAADLNILSEKVDTMYKTSVSKPNEIPSLGECCKCSNFGDTRFLSLCSLLWCPYPGLCVVQNYLMKSLHLPREDPGRPTWNICWDNCGFAGLPLVTCCLGLSWNRERIARQTVSGKGNFFTDCLAFMCCLGFCPMMRDELFIFPIKRKLSKKFKEGLWVCFDLKKVKKGWNCIGCFSALLCPFPSVCCLQACTIIEIEEVLRSVTPVPLVDKGEKRSLLIKHFLIGSLGCCIGLALNRSKIADGLGVDEHCGCDCLWYMCGCCQCLAVQECYTVDLMRSPSEDQH